MKDNQKRIRILSAIEQDALYGLPTFNDYERAYYFSLDEHEKREMEALRSLESRVHFIMQLGYFKAKLMFFECGFSECIEDITYIVNHCFSERFDVQDVTKRIRYANYSRILTLFSYRFLDDVLKEKLDQNALELARICVDPRFIFNNLLTFLEEHRIVLPGYSTLQNCVSQAITTESNRLYVVIENALSPSVDEILKGLMTHGDTDKFYGITVLKKDAKGFNYKEMMKEVEKKKASEVLFKSAKTIIPTFAISEQNIYYYASLVDYYSVNRLKKLSYDNVRLYILCYIYYRFEKIHDNLISNFFYTIGIYQKRAKEHAKNAVYEHKTETNEYVRRVADILDFFLDEKVADETSFGAIRAKVFALVPKNQFPHLLQHLREQSFDENKFKWDYYLKIAKTITKNLRPLVGSIDFESEDPNDPLMKALTFVKQTFATKKSLKHHDFSLFPIDFVPASLQEYLYEEVERDGVIQTVLNVYQYEFLIYHQLANMFDSERFFVNTSFNYKSIKEDLYPDWERNKDEILEKLNNPVLNTPIKEQMRVFEEEFNPLILDVNQRIKNGENTSIHIKKETIVIIEGEERTVTEWTFPYQKQEEEIDNPFYDQLPRVSLYEVLRFVHEKCSLLDAFTHIKPHYAKSNADEAALFAVITALATGYGISYMADICDIGYTHLLNMYKNFIRLETLKTTNAILVDKLAELPMFKRWNLLDDELLASIDGQKMFIRRPHWMARHSSKYFGQKRGVVSLSLIANNACLNTKVTSPNDYEGHHLFDVFFNNITHVKPDFLCGDTHSINHVNFALMHLLGCSFIPHIKNIREQATLISSFENPALYKDYLIVPKDQFSEKLIEESWPQIQHIYASLLTKKTTQSALIRKISSYARPSKTQRALWEYNKILHDNHLLNVINDPNLRQGIRTGLNRGEGYHQLTGKIGSINGNKLRGTTELELAISNECIRLIANCIIFYNTYILSELYDIHEKLGNTDVLEFIKRLSPIAWRHINLNGRYEFTSLMEMLDLSEILANLVFEHKKSYTKS
jgi:TnpA family transposase